MTEEDSNNIVDFLAQILREGKWQLYSSHRKRAERFLGELKYFGYKIIHNDWKECDCKKEELEDKNDIS
jgi:hypothetical protein